MSITSSTGIGSGININGIVGQLVKVEGQPQLNTITRQETASQTRLSALGTLKGALSAFQTSVQNLKNGNLFKTNQAASSNTAILTATPGTGSVAGTHTVEVTQLAKAQQSITSTEYANASAPVATGGGGVLNFSYPAGSAKTAFSVTIGATNNTLAGVRDAINNATGNNGVTASIVSVNSTVTPGATVSKLVLTAKNTGTANGFTLAVTGGDAGLNKLDTTAPANYSTTAAADAMIKVDGLAATRGSNTISDVLPGVTLNLQSAAAGTIVNLNVTPDQTVIGKALNDFVTSYNTLRSTMKDLGKYGGGSGAANGSMIGDSTLRNMKSQLRQDAGNPVASATSGYNSLAMIGVTIDKNGVMALDSGKLNTALKANPAAVSDVFSSANGVANRLDTRLTGYLQSGGPLDSQQTAQNKQLRSLSANRDAVQLRLDSLQKSMQKQFIAMDQAVGLFKSTGSFLTQNLGR